MHLAFTLLLTAWATLLASRPSPNHPYGVDAPHKEAFIGCVSAPDNLAKLTAVRETWVHSEYVRNSAIFRFIIGHSEDKFINEEITRENEKFNDIIIVKMNETYRILANKTFMVFREGLRAGTDWIIKIDDDVMPRIDVIGAFLRLQNRNPEMPKYVGKMWTENIVDRNPTHDKWYVPKDVYEQPIFPEYANGPFYAINHKLAKLIARKTPQVHLEDVSVGLAVVNVEFAGEDVEYVDIELGGRYARGCTSRWAHYYHKFTPSQLQCMWAKYMKDHDGNLCCTPPPEKMSDAFLEFRQYRPGYVDE